MADKICVLGAGVVGLSTAVQLQARFPTHPITLIADQFNENTLSNGAGGIFRISPSVQGPRPESVRTWAKFAYQHYQSILRSEDSALAGVQEVSGYMLFTVDKNAEKESRFLKEFAPNLRTLTREELQQFSGDFNGGIFYTTVLTDCSKYLPYLTDKFVTGGGRITKATIKSLDELSKDYDIVVNCGGLRSGDLCNDAKILPLRGQVFRLKAPWIKHFYYADLDTYIIPSTDTVVLGGTRQYHSYNTSIDRYDSASIWERCCKLIPSLKHAEVVKEWVGLRPHRDTIRVEAEIFSLDHKELKVVHNYGHGGYGICLSWGTAKEATDLVEKFLTNCHTNSKL